MMPRPKGETHHSASITEAQAKDIKSDLVQGLPVSRVAQTRCVAYQTVYRIASGETLREVAPAGPVSKANALPGPKRRISARMQYLLWKKRREGISIASLAHRAKLSNSSVRRLVMEFELVLCHRVSQLQLTAGSYEPVQRKYGIRRNEAQRMDDRAMSTPLPDRLRSCLEALGELEQGMNARGRNA
jgi:hypothetical protein